ncbi:MAG: FG-GAP-like repeat-containing protein [Verrucomicrobiales bacterium]|nr:FG-GAP-like repeat-containing protein [Verrucomicrobiales bacterium]
MPRCVPTTCWALVLAWMVVALQLGSAQQYGRDRLTSIGAFLDGVFPATAPGVDGVGQPPSLLSETGVFTDLATLSPRAGLMPYGVNSPLWTDGSVKQRWVAVPNDGTANSAAEQIQFSPDSPWAFPVGTVAVKQFDLPTDERDSSQIRRVETRFIVRAANGGVYGVTYQWREDGADADLLLDGASQEITVTDTNGTVSTQTWSYPSRTDCLSCHNPHAGYLLGLNTHQLNGDFTYPSTGRSDNQLRTLNHLGLFSPRIDESAIASYLSSVPLTDTSVPVETRVRSYLDANCAHCHRPDALATSFDTRFTTPFDEQNLIDGSVLYDLGVEDARVIVPRSIQRSILHRRVSSVGIHQMPPIGRNVVHDQAVTAISEWILSLTPDPGGGGDNRSPVALDDEASTLQGDYVDIPVLSNDSDLDEDALALESWTAPTNGLLEWLANGFARYTPAGNFIGTDSFTYVVNDGAGGTSNAGTVTIDVISGTNSASITFLDRSSRLANPSHASGVAMGIADMDQDGLDDIVHLNAAKDLFIDHQSPEGARFVAQSLGRVSSQRQWGLCLADADDNGYPDVLSGGYYDDLHLKWNNGSRKAYNSTNLTSPRLFLQAVNFADINGDGYLDIFACHDVGDNAKFRGGNGRGFVYDNSLINTRTTPSSDNSGNYGTVWTDYDNDGDLDLYLSKCRGGVSNPADPRRINMFFRNDGAAGFTNVASDLGMAFGAQSWAADFGDIDNDGDLDCFVGNHHDSSVVMQNNGDGTFTNITASSGISVNWRVIQTVFRDFNNDSWLDLLLVGQAHELWLNDRAGAFTRSSEAFTSTTIESCAVGDLNRDGFTDVYAGYAKIYNTPEASRPDKLFLASPNSNGFLSVSLEGVASNKSAIGARLELHGPWGVQVREVRGGESYGISHSFTQIFGLGNALNIEKLWVRWPSGLVEEVFDPEPNQFLKLREGGAVAPVLVNPGPQANQVGEAIGLALAGSDPTNDVLTYSAVNLPLGLQIDQSNGVVSGTLSESSAGNYSVLVSVSDPWSTVSQSFSWEVRPPESAPAVVLSTGAASVMGPFEVTIRFTTAVTGLSLDDFVLSNAKASSLSGAGGVYRFDVTPDASGAITVHLPVDSATDDGGRGNLESNTLPVFYELPFTAPVIESFESVLSALTEGESTDLEWSVLDGGAPLTALTITPDLGSVLGLSSIVVKPTATITYTLTATNVIGSVTTETTITVDRPLPTEDKLANLSVPGSVVHGESVTVSVEYAATGARELWVWLQDSNGGWRPAAQGNVSVSAGSGSQTFDLVIDTGARAGDGYVWVMRLLPIGWATADDALAEYYGLADVQAGTAPPEVDALGAIVLPELVKSPDTVTLDIPYQATERRELRVYLHDSRNGWFTIAKGNTTVEPGSGTHAFTLPVITGALEGEGYVWAVRLLPLGATTADEAIDADYGNATVERNSGGPATQDILTSVVAPNAVQPATVVEVQIDYEATARRDLGIWLHDSTDNWRTIGQGLVKVDPGIGSQTFNIGIVGDTQVGAGYIWAVRLLPEGWADADEAFDAFYKDAQVDERSTDLVNLAVLPGASATQSSVYGTVFEADLARDGNTDGDWRNGSVSHTELDVDAWWDLDLGTVRAIDHLLLWNRNDCCGDRLVPYHVFVSEEPFVSSDVTEVSGQPGVSKFTYNEVPLPTQRIDVNRNVRYVRVQLSGVNYLSLAEVEVYGSRGGTLVNGITYSYYEGMWNQLPDFATLNPFLTGTLSTINLTPRVRDDFFAIRYRGCLAVPEDGDYTLFLRSDEGSRLYLDGSLVVDNDGVHEVTEVSETVPLTAGMHPLEIHYFEREGAETLEVSWAGPGFTREEVSNEAITVNERGENLGFHHVGRRVPTHDNADGDLLDLAAEYALGRNPYVGSMEDVGIDLQAHDDGTRLSVSYERPAYHSNIDYWLEVSADLLSWSTVLEESQTETIRYGWEKVSFDHLETLPGMSLKGGFVRLRIWHHDWNYETTTPICGWYRTAFNPGYQTHGVSLNAAPIYASNIAEADVDRARITLAVPGVRALLGEGAYYLELASGQYEGHRFDIDLSGTTDQVVSLDLRGSCNTLSALPSSGIRFSQAVVRPHRLLGEVYPIGRFQGSKDPASADQVQFFNGTGYDSYFLLDAGGRRHWVSSGDTDLKDAHHVIIPPGEGAFVRLANDSDEAPVLVTGHLRDHAFIQPLRRGYNLLAPSAPLEMSPQTRGLTLGNGFLGNADPTGADQVQLWLGDLVQGTLGYRGYFLLEANGHRHWTGATDLDLKDEDGSMLFKGNRAFFFQAAGEPHRSYRVPAVEIQRER